MYETVVMQCRGKCDELNLNTIEKSHQQRASSDIGNLANDKKKIIHVRVIWNKVTFGGSSRTLRVND